jgi:hypothetical protein
MAGKVHCNIFNVFLVFPCSENLKGRDHTKELGVEKKDNIRMDLRENRV